MFEKRCRGQRMERCTERSEGHIKVWQKGIKQVSRRGKCAHGWVTLAMCVNRKWFCVCVRKRLSFQPWPRSWSPFLTVTNCLWFSNHNEEVILTQTTVVMALETSDKWLSGQKLTLECVNMFTFFFLILKYLPKDPNPNWHFMSKTIL